MKIYLTIVPPRLILIQDAIPPRIVLDLIGLWFQSVDLLMIYFSLAVRAHVEAWARFFIFGVFPPSADAAAVCFG